MAESLRRRGWIAQILARRNGSDSLRHVACLGKRQSEAAVLSVEPMCEIPEVACIGQLACFWRPPVLRPVHQGRWRSIAGRPWPLPARVKQSNLQELHLRALCPQGQQGAQGRQRVGQGLQITCGAGIHKGHGRARMTSPNWPRASIVDRSCGTPAPWKGVSDRAVQRVSWPVRGGVPRARPARKSRGSACAARS